MAMTALNANKPMAKPELIAPRRMTLAQACAAWNVAHKPHTPGTVCGCGRCGR